MEMNKAKEIANAIDAMAQRWGRTDGLYWEAREIAAQVLAIMAKASDDGLADEVHAEMRAKD